MALKVIRYLVMKRNKICSTLQAYKHYKSFTSLPQCVLIFAADLRNPLTTTQSLNLNTTIHICAVLVKSPRYVLSMSLLFHFFAFYHHSNTWCMHVVLGVKFDSMLIKRVYDFIQHYLRQCLILSLNFCCVKKPCSRTQPQYHS